MLRGKRTIWIVIKVVLQPAMYQELSYVFMSCYWGSSLNNIIRTMNILHTDVVSMQIF